MKIALCIPGSRKWSEYFICKDIKKYLEMFDHDVELVYDRKPTWKLCDYDRILFRIRYQEDYENRVFQNELKDRSWMWVGGPDLFNRIDDWSIFENLICQSIFIKDELIEKTNAARDQVYVAAAGIDTDIFFPVEDIERDIPLGTVGNKKQPRKRYGETSEAFPNIYWHDGWNDTKLTPDEMNQLYNRMDKYICYSDFEAGPMPVLEAGACGCKLISTPVGYGKELENCKVVHNEEEAKEAVENYEETAVEEIKNNYSWEVLISDWCEVMDIE